MFLKLEDYRGESIRINFNFIESYGRNTNGSHTYICPIGCTSDDDMYLVKETPEQIDDMLKEDKES